MPARATPATDPDLREQRRVIDAFLAASRNGDFEALLEVLDPDVVFRVDAGGVPPLARPPVEGADAVAAQILERGSPFPRFARPTIVNRNARRSCDGSAGATPVCRRPKRIVRERPT